MRFGSILLCAIQFGRPRILYDKLPMFYGQIIMQVGRCMQSPGHGGFPHQDALGNALSECSGQAKQSA